MNMNRKSSKIKISIAVSLILLLALFSAIVYANQNKISLGLLGQQLKILKETKDDGTYAIKINGKAVSNKVFEEYKLISNFGRAESEKLSDKELADKIIERDLLYSKAKEAGITLDETEFNKAFEISKKNIKKDAEQYEEFKSYIKNLGMDEDQYWESVKPLYQKAFLIGSFKNSLKKDFQKSLTNQTTATSQINQKEINEKFDKYYKDYIKDLKANAKIEYSKNLK